VRKITPRDRERLGAGISVVDMGKKCTGKRLRPLSQGANR
jgi:hypothetical protein